MYRYLVEVVRVVDGDTILVEVDLGFHTKTREMVRLFGINAPEVVGASKLAGLAASSYLYALCAKVNFTLMMQSYKPNPRDKYGRYIGDLYTLDAVSISKAMIDGGHAVAASYE